jgi:hypothetical protein
MFRFPKTTSRKLIAICLIVILAVVLIYLLVIRKPHSNSVIPSSANPQTSTTNQGQQTSSESSSLDASSDSDSKFPTPTQDASAVLLSPSGTFVSNHRPSLSGTAQQLEEQSVCSSTTGARCFIRFTQGSVTKSLASQVIGGTGTTYWSWNIKDSGLTEGSWIVEAVATLDGQEKTTKDNIDLLIQK